MPRRRRRLHRPRKLLVRNPPNRPRSLQSMEKSVPWLPPREARRRRITKNNPHHQLESLKPNRKLKLRRSSASLSRPSSPPQLLSLKRLSKSRLQLKGPQRRLRLFVDRRLRPAPFQSHKSRFERWAAIYLLDPRRVGRGPPQELGGRATARLRDRARPRGWRLLRRIRRWGDRRSERDRALRVGPTRPPPGR